LSNTLLNLITEAPDEYVFPNDMTLYNLTVEHIKGTNFPPYTYAYGSLYPNGIHQLGNPVLTWLEGRFITVYANNIETGDGTGTSRRVLLERDPFEVSYKDLTDKPDRLQGEQGPPSPPGPPGPAPDAPGYVATPTYESNTLAMRVMGWRT
jgi:hypothetical protein